MKGDENGVPRLQRYRVFDRANGATLERVESTSLVPMPTFSAQNPYVCLSAQVSALEAQLAEAKALLREAPNPSPSHPDAAGWAARRAALLGEEE